MHTAVSRGCGSGEHALAQPHEQGILQVFVAHIAYQNVHSRPAVNGLSPVHKALYPRLSRASNHRGSKPRRFPRRFGSPSLSHGGDLHPCHLNGKSLSKGIIYLHTIDLHKSHLKTKIQGLYAPRINPPLPEADLATAAAAQTGLSKERS